jgi:hypothetical protein
MYFGVIISRCAGVSYREYSVLGPEVLEHG